MEKYDLIIVGAGPAGIFTAVELLRHGSKKKMLLVEKGKPVEKRHSPESIVASVPSITALNTSDTSERVARGFSVMVSSMFVAVITTLPAALTLVMIIFW